MKRLTLLLIPGFLALVSVANAGQTKAKLIGTWRRETGEGNSRTVMVLSFHKDGAFEREVTHPGLSQGIIDTSLERSASGKWRLVTEKAGLGVISADPTTLIVEYEELVNKPRDGLSVSVPGIEKRSHVYRVIIGKKAGGQETLQLVPTGGDLKGTLSLQRVDAAN
jgi:hypothetical protein